MKKINFIIAGLLISAAMIGDLYAAEKATNTKSAKNCDSKIEVKKSQMDTLNMVAQELIDGAKVNASGVEELFKYINGAIQTNDRETPLLDAVNRAKEHKLRVVAYIEGNDTIIASSDPELIGKNIADFKTECGMVVRDKAIEELKKSTNGRATFTYKSNSKKDGAVTVVENRVVTAVGREAFENLKNSDKKFLLTIAAEVDQ
jgi:hypothetical protein